jgi:hypothetical protein
MFHVFETNINAEYSTADLALVSLCVAALVMLDTGFSYVFGMTVLARDCSNWFQYKAPFD